VRAGWFAGWFIDVVPALLYSFVIVLQCIPAVSITAGIPTYTISLGFVLLFDGIVTAREDYKRHKDDKIANTRVGYVFRKGGGSGSSAGGGSGSGSAAGGGGGGVAAPNRAVSPRRQDGDGDADAEAAQQRSSSKGGFVAVPYQDIVVGDIVKVMRGQEFPADLVFLAAKHAEPWQRSLCQVQTAQLDGETNLKIRRAPDCVYERFEFDENLADFRGYLRCEEPTEHFGRFTAFIHPDGDVDAHTVGESFPLNADNTLLRGCVLRNVEYIYGLVVYTGNQTKVLCPVVTRFMRRCGPLVGVLPQLIECVCVCLCVCVFSWEQVRVKQNSKRPTKLGSIESVVNRNLVFLVFLLFANCTAGAVGYSIWSTTPENLQEAWYLMVRAHVWLRNVLAQCASRCARCSAPRHRLRTRLKNTWSASSRFSC
jgi:hypothetical protein